MALCAIYAVALGALVVPIFVGLSLHVLAVKPADWTPEASLSVVKAIGAAAALVSNILFGVLGDRTARTRWGRVPWMLGGAAVGGVLVAFTGRSTSFTALVVLWALSQFAYNACLASVVATISDLTPATDRSRVSGWWGASAMGSVVLGLGAVTFLHKTDFVFFDLVPLISIPIVLLAARHLVRHTTTTRTSETRHLTRSAPSPGWRGQFALLLVQAFLVQVAYNTATVYSVYFLVRRVAMSATHAATWASSTLAIASGVSMLAALLGTRWARVGRRSDRPMASGIVIVIAGLGLLVLTTSPVVYGLAVVLAGAGYGMYGATDLGLVIRLVPSDIAGRMLGIFNLARTLPQSLVPTLAPFALAIGGDVTGQDRSQDFAALYIGGALCGVVGLSTLVRLRIRTADEAPATLIAPV